ncbi:MAG: hypothetical protein ACOCVF_01720 [bacterium]
MGKLTKNELIDLLGEMGFESLEELSYNELYQAYKEETENDKFIEDNRDEDSEDERENDKEEDNDEDFILKEEIDEVEPEKEISLKEKLKTLSTTQRRMYEKTGKIPNLKENI